MTFCKFCVDLSNLQGFICSLRQQNINMQIAGDELTYVPLECKSQSFVENLFEWSDHKTSKQME